MKVRSGFVSNSSTSSFIICGKYMEGQEKLKELINNTLTPDESKKVIELLEGDDTFWEASEEFESLTKMSIYSQEWSDGYTVGYQENAETMTLDQMQLLMSKGKSTFGDDVRLHVIVDQEY